MKKLLLIFAVLLAALRAQAYDFEVDGIYYNVISLQDLTCKVTHSGKTDRWGVLIGGSYSGSVVIPSTVTYSGRTFSVTEIGGYAFDLCNELTSVEIPNSVTTIGEGAFKGCSNLTSVVIPNSVSTIGENAFWHCSSLTSMVIPNSVTTIASGAFEGCSSLTSVEIPNSVTTIDRSVFSNCI